MEHGDHPNVVPLLDALLDGETPWLMYEYVGGGSLADLILRWQSVPDAEREALALHALAQLAHAVGTFHRLAPAVVHRDLKPANILLQVSSHQVPSPKSKAVGSSTWDLGLGDLRLMVTDFGIGGVAVGGPAAGATGMLGTSLRGTHTPLYASPQQARGDAPDPRDDVHALGVIAFQMLTGKLLDAPGPRFERELRARSVSAALIALIGDCVDPDPSSRPTDAAELAERVEAKNLSPQPPPLRREEEQEQKNAPTNRERQRAVPAPPPFLGEGAGGRGSSALDGAAHTFLAPAVALDPEPWLVPLRGMWFSRPTDRADAPWTLSGARLPGEVIVRPGEAYRLAISPDSTDIELAKLRALAGLPGLEAVDLSGCVYITDAGLMHLADLRGLKAVALADTQATDSGVSLLLTRFPDIEAVSLAGAAGVSDAIVPHLLRLRKLKSVSLPLRADSADVRADFAKRRPACRLV